MEVFDDPDEIVISDYLTDFDKKRGRGPCRACGKPIQWSRLCVVSHMRACQKTSADDKKNFLRIWKKSFAAKQKLRRKKWLASKNKGAKVAGKKKSNLDEEDEDDEGEEEEDQLVNEIVGLIKSGNLPIETVENKSFQKILNRAGKTRKLNLKAESIRELIHQEIGEDAEDDYEMDESSKSIIKNEVEDGNENVTEVWLSSLKSDEEFDTESLTEFDVQQSKRPSTSKSSKSITKSDKFIDRKLAEMLISSSTPLELVDHPGFRSFIEAINPNYRLPNSYSLKSRLVEFIRKDF